MFDGVHLGHFAVLEVAVASARRTGGVAAALTFDPHPSRLLHPEQAVPLIQPMVLKVERMLSAGLDLVITQTFTPEFAAVEAEDLLAHLKKALPQLHSIYVGENWRFGRGRRGDINLLNELGHREGVGVFSAPRVNFDGEPISSTRIRTALETGEIETANALLGYTYRSQGEVAGGRELGRSMGFPTLNLRWEPECRPCYGVYAVRVGRWGEQATLPAVANYGVRPTVETADEPSPQLEVHLLGEDCPFGPGDELMVEWERFLRPEQRFDGVETLRAQIAKDCDAARQWFE
jgi:riboflavin kinase/FMN adenylyltransferase